MAPKAAAVAAPVAAAASALKVEDLQAAAADVAGADLNVRAAALTKLAETYKLDAKTESIWLQSGVIPVVAAAMQTTDKAQQEYVARVLQRFASSRGAVQRAAFDSTTITAVYNVLIDYDANFEELTKAPAVASEAIETAVDPKAKGKAPPAKKGAAPVAEASAAVVAPQLGPPKSLLYAAIRILDTVCFTSLAAIETLVSIGLGPVATVLEHHESQRIRMQGLKLVATMARSVEAVDALAHAGAVISVVNNIQSNDAALVPASFAALRRLAARPGLAIHEMERLGMDSYLLEMVNRAPVWAAPDPAAAAAPPKGKGAAAETEAPALSLDAAAIQTQLTAAEVFITMCNSACIVAEHGVQDGAFDLLKALLPDPDLIDQLDAGNLDAFQAVAPPTTSPFKAATPTVLVTALRLLGAIGQWAPQSDIIAGNLMTAPFVRTLLALFWEPPAPPPAEPAAAPEAEAGGKEKGKKDKGKKEEAAAPPPAATPAAVVIAAPPGLLAPPYDREVREAALHTLSLLTAYKPFAQRLLTEGMQQQGGAPQRLSWLRANLERRPLPELDPAPTLLGRLGFAASPEDAAAAGVLAALQAFAARVHGGAGGDAAAAAPPRTRTGLSRALLTLPMDSYVAKPRPPPDTPPRTPSPPPLATSQFIWDALDRPIITDGAVLQPAAPGVHAS